MPSPISASSREYRRWWSEYSAYSNCASEFASRASQMLLATSMADLAKWDPFGDGQLLYAVRASRLSILGMILVDLDGFEPPSSADISKERKGEVLSLLLEARSTLIDAILGIPETVTTSREGKTTELLSIGGYGPTEISFYVDIPKQIPENYWVLPEEPDKLATSYWLLDEASRWVKDMSNGLGRPSFHSQLIECVKSVYCEKKPANPQVLSDGQSVESANKEMLAEIIGYLRVIESLYPFPKTSFADMANICYDIAGRAPDARPEWAGQTKLFT